ncbi:hypothetical protein OE09_0027 [Flavobacteriaceae bacterium MAR_2010_72]|nr:hypothetical protein OE09_0027 [Flavobacteriaceae bacterium MAR_2010_72]
MSTFELSSPIEIISSFMFPKSLVLKLPNLTLNRNQKV